MTRQPTLRKGYCDVSSGQLHWRMWEYGEAAEKKVNSPDLVCLHPAPFSGIAFQNLAPLLAKSRRVWAPDYPGHGQSDAFAGELPSIGDIATSIGEFVDRTQPQNPVDLLGFHTGCFVGSELSVQRPNTVRRLCLIDIPAFDEAAAAALAKRYQTPQQFESDLETLGPAWDQVIGKRHKSQGMEQALAMLADQLQAGSRANQAFHAAFSYPWRNQLAKVRVPVLAIGSKSPLLEGTRAAASSIEAAVLIERLDITRSVIDEAAATTAEVVREFLDRRDDAPAS